MRRFWLLLFITALLITFPGERTAYSLEGEPELTILYTASTFGKLRPCAV